MENIISVHWQYLFEVAAVYYFVGLLTLIIDFYQVAKSIIEIDFSSLDTHQVNSVSEVKSKSMTEEITDFLSRLIPRIVPSLLLLFLADLFFMMGILGVVISF